MNRYERRRRLMFLLPGVLALLGFCSRYIGSASADTEEAPLTSDYHDAQASISADAYQQCAITAAKGVQCRGWGQGGRLGDGTENSSETFVDVVGLNAEVKAVVAGSSTTCALTTSGGAKCWGGQVGDGSVNNYSSTAVDVQGMTSDVRQISIGGGFTCFVTTASEVKCLGENGWGQLGDGTRTSTSTVSTAVQGLGSNVRSIASMGQATCAIMLDTTVKCWGYAGFGQLGYGGYGIDANNPYVDTAVTVSGLSSVVALAAGNSFICALTSAGAVYCWGNNGDGQFGNGNNTSSPTPVAISNLQSGVRAITAGIASMCALLDTNEVKCAGRNSEAGLGLGYTSGPQSTPVALSGLSGTITAVTLGSYHGCALNSIGELRCWGSVPGLNGPVLSPTLISGFDGVHTRIITDGAVVLLRNYYPTIFQPAPDANPVNLGVRVTTSEAGTITKVLFAKSATNLGTHYALVWDSGGNVLAQQQFTNETATGWQEVTLTTPVSVAAGDTFTVGYSQPQTGFAYGPGFPSLTVGPLTISSGYYRYSGTPTDFPDGTVGSNYGIDFEFMAAVTPPTTTTTTTSTTSTTTTTTVPETTTTTTTIPETTSTTSTTTSTTIDQGTTTTTTDASSTTTSTTQPATTTSTSSTTTTPATTTSSTLPPAPAVVTTSTEPATTTTSSTTTTTEPPTTTSSSVPDASDAVTPDGPASEAEQIAVIASLDEPNVTAADVVAAVSELIDSGLTPTAATDLATNTKVLESIDPSQAAEVFAAMPVSSLTPEQVEAVSAALTNAPTEIKAAFEETIDIYGDAFDTYVPVGSVVPVATRKTLVAAMAAVTSIAAATAVSGTTMTTGTATRENS